MIYYDLRAGWLCRRIPFIIYDPTSLSFMIFIGVMFIEQDVIPTNAVGSYSPRRSFRVRPKKSIGKVRWTFFSRRFADHSKKNLSGEKEIFFKLLHTACFRTTTIS
jgi:hypothetical protein